jgi:hypothetical protein
MAKPRTVTPVVESVPMGKITFPGAKMADFGRSAPDSGYIKFHCTLPKGFENLFTAMGWDVPGRKTTSENLEGKLEGGHLILTSRDKLIDAEVNIEFSTITKFACHRFELEGKKGKGFRRELRFEAKFKCVDGAANLENYMMRTDNARGVLQVTYLLEPIEQQLPLDAAAQDEANQVDIPSDVMASPEQREAVQDLGDNTLASSRQLGKRGRLADVQ